MDKPRSITAWIVWPIHWGGAALYSSMATNTMARKNHLAAPGGKRGRSNAMKEAMAVVIVTLRSTASSTVVHSGSSHTPRHGVRLSDRTLITRISNIQTQARVTARRS